MCGAPVRPGIGDGYGFPVPWRLRMFPVPARAQASHDGSARDPADEDGRNDVSITQGGQLDEAKLEAFVGQAVTDMGAAISDPVQPHPGGQAMTVAPIAARAASPPTRS